MRDLLLGARAEADAQLPPSFLLQFKNYAQLAKSLKRASCHAAALAAHFKDEGWRDCVTVLDDAVAAAGGRQLGAPKSSSSAAAASAEPRMSKSAPAATATTTAGGGAENGGDDANGAEADADVEGEGEGEGQGDERPVVGA